MNNKSRNDETNVNLALKVHIGDRVKGNNSGIALVNAVQSSPRGWSIETLDQNRRLITNNAKASIPSGDAFKSTHTSLAKSQSALLNQDRVSGHASVQFSSVQFSSVQLATTIDSLFFLISTLMQVEKNNPFDHSSDK
ncbi:hypothetical protein T4A_2630 [Trichinella pseudospiralis]|uniref:Uncharacterized protein n=1 Tax=Trichinella pseudospiralis TaxID=6337 RepID=A0A0V1EE84_TRIPS|nr:hypothetical protein T4A_2630 [Trichinella pseudospiralis]